MKGYEISFHLIKYDLNKKYLKNNSNFINNFYSEFEKKFCLLLLKKNFTYKKDTWIKFTEKKF